MIRTAVGVCIGYVAGSVITNVAWFVRRVARSYRAARERELAREPIPMGDNLAGRGRKVREPTIPDPGVPERRPPNPGRVSRW